MEDPTVQINEDYSGIIQNSSQAASSGNTYSEPITTTEPESTTVFVEQDTTPENITNWDAFWSNAVYELGGNQSEIADFQLLGEYTGY